MASKNKHNKSINMVTRLTKKYGYVMDTLDFININQKKSKREQYFNSSQRMQLKEEFRKELENM